MIRVKLSCEEAAELLRQSNIRYGSWQWSVVRWGATARGCRGKARNYFPRYSESVGNLKAKLESIGILSEYSFGSRGGWLGGLENFIFVGLSQYLIKLI